MRSAWLSLLMLLPVFGLAVLVGDWLLNLQGYDDGDESVPLSAALVAGGLALLVLIAPGIAALFYGLRARRHGAPAGRCGGGPQRSPPGTAAGNIEHEAELTGTGPDGAPATPVPARHPTDTGAHRARQGAEP